MSQFPQPTRPVQSYDLAPIQTPKPSQNANMDNIFFEYTSMPEERLFQFDFPERLMPQTTAATEEEEKQAIKYLIRVVSEWYEKLPENIRSQINLDRFNIVSGNNYTAEQGFKVGATAISGHNEQLKEIKHKLERLKIRTMDISTSTRGRGVNVAGDQEPRQKLERFKIRTVQLGEVAEEEVKQ